MKKIFLFLATSMLAMGAMAQQWAGSTTIIDTIYRNGTVRLMSGIDIVGKNIRATSS